MNPVEIRRGESPVVLGMPHTGTWVPDEIMGRLTPLGRTLGDTDWHIDRLYDGLLPRATIVRATFHRYVIDANRDPSGASLYPGKNTTGLVPTINFDGEPLWEVEPTYAEIESRKRDYHQTYHSALAAELDRVRSIHGIALLYDCHSIRSHIPFLFNGRLPDFNIGTNGGATCDVRFESLALETCASSDGYSTVLNGRFKGGWTTRHYGRPSEGIHAIQMELAQNSYLQMECPPFSFDPRRAQPLRERLRYLLEQLETAALNLKDQT